MLPAILPIAGAEKKRFKVWFFAPSLLSTDRNVSEGIRRSVYSLYRAKEIALAEIDAVLAEQGVRHRHVKEEIG